MKNAKSRKIFLNKIAHDGMKYWKERINIQISMIRLNGVMWENEKDKWKNHGNNNKTNK